MPTVRSYRMGSVRPTALWQPPLDDVRLSQPGVAMKSEASRGNTVPSQGQTQKPQRVPRAPHERDESADNQGSSEASAREIGGLAHDDAARGVPDTSKQPEMDRAYDTLKKA